ncbi:unnamed protein product [Strongylus vulgaris]|uniref:Mannosyltransferase n=1 Tax=Strongylus vulgaris TaxID=40348 RepID=A0A3P7JFQ5_STRVU|nr:unnamed protein product [Strongylus vulgaris]
MLVVYLRYGIAMKPVFRCELVLLFAPIFTPVLLSGRLPLFGWDGALLNGLRTAIQVLTISIPIDSLLWGRPIYPEFEVAVFNILKNRSHEYGPPFFMLEQEIILVEMQSHIYRHSLLRELQFIFWTQRIDAKKPMSVYIDNACAQTGVSRFMQLYDAWEYVAFLFQYNKTETLTPEDMERFDFLMIGTYTGNLKDIVTKNYSTYHRVMFAIPAFHRFTLK